MNSDPAAERPANSTDASIGIVVSDWHSEITKQLLDSAIATLEQCGVAREDIFVSHVPRTMELTFGARQMSINKEPSAVIVLGCMIKENNLQYDIVCQSVANGITQLDLHNDIPFIFGVLTANTYDEACTLAAGANNKGTESAETALKMVNMMADLINS